MRPVGAARGRRPRPRRRPRPAAGAARARARAAPRRRRLAAEARAAHDPRRPARRCAARRRPARHRVRARPDVGRRRPVRARLLHLAHQGRGARPARVRDLPAGVVSVGRRRPVRGHAPAGDPAAGVPQGEGGGVGRARACRRSSRASSPASCWRWSRRATRRRSSPPMPTLVTVGAETWVSTPRRRRARPCHRRLPGREAQRRAVGVRRRGGRSRRPGRAGGSVMPDFVAWQRPRLTGLATDPPTTARLAAELPITLHDDAGDLARAGRVPDRRPRRRRRAVGRAGHRAPAAPGRGRRRGDDARPRRARRARPAVAVLTGARHAGRRGRAAVARARRRHARPRSRCWPTDASASPGRSCSRRIRSRSRRAWAHVHDVPGRRFARIVCPRQLTVGQDYLAVLVPGVAGHGRRRRLDDARRLVAHGDRVGDAAVL